jgi:hypothetical protein
VAFSVGRFIRFTSTVICLIVTVWFVVFAADQTKSASGHQQEMIASQSVPVPGAASAGVGGEATSGPAAAHAEKKSEVHRALDETASGLTSPFSGIVDSSSEWLTNGVKLLAALIVYGFGLGYLARTIRIAA